jgi:hypothetical protein
MLSHLYFFERGDASFGEENTGDLFQTLKDLKLFPG